MKVKYTGKDILDLSKIPYRPKFDEAKFRRLLAAVMKKYGLDRLEVSW